MTSQNSSLPITANDEGLHLVDTILWLDSPSCRELSFLSSATPPLPQSARGHPQTRWIAVDETIALASAMGRDYNALRCQYHRPFSVGSIKLEMLPSGGGVGTASLYVENNNKSAIYAPTVQPLRSPLSRQMELKSADILILRAVEDPSINMHPQKSLNTVTQRIIELVENDVWPIVRCAPSPTAQLITRELTDQKISTSVASQISKVHKFYDSCGVALGSYTNISNRKKDKKRVQIQTLKSTRNTPLDPRVIQLQFQGKMEEYRISLWAGVQDLKQVIEKVSPKTTFVTGPYAKSYAQALDASGPIHAVYPNNQPTLF